MKTKSVKKKSAKLDGPVSPAWFDLLAIFIEKKNW
jgi:hypothetical protein